MIHDVVVCSLEGWDSVWRRNQYLVAGLLASDPTLRVLFVEPPVDPVHVARSGGRPRRGAGLRRIDGVGGVAPGRLWALEPTKWLPRAVGPLADRWLVDAVVGSARQLGVTDPVLWINDPAAAAVLRRTGWPSLYDITDDWLRADRAPRVRARLEADEGLLLSRCAEVVVCSEGLAASKGATRPVQLIPNAVDVAHYRAPTGRPPDLPDGPSAVYVGTLHHDRIDVDLCVAVARALPDGAHLVLVGPNLLGEAATDRLREEGNVVLTGPVGHREVPAYLQHADVLVIPHAVTPFTESLDPIKAYEYLAVGRPVVTTPVPGYRLADAPGVTVAAPVALAGAVAMALEGPRLPAGARPPTVDVPDWGERVAAMAEVLRSVAREAGRRAG